MCAMCVMCEGETHVVWGENREFKEIKEVREDKEISENKEIKEREGLSC